MLNCIYIPENALNIYQNERGDRGSCNHPGGPCDRRPFFLSVEGNRKRGRSGVIVACGIEKAVPPAMFFAVSIGKANQESGGMELIAISGNSVASSAGSTGMRAGFIQPCLIGPRGLLRLVSILSASKKSRGYGRYRNPLILHY